MRKSNLERLREARAGIQQQMQLTGVEGLLEHLLGGPPNPTQLAVIESRERVRGYMGAAGAAKTSTGCALMWLRALLDPGFRGFISRNDYNDLTTTTLERMTDMLNKLPPGTLLDRDKSPPMKWYIRPIGFQGMPDDAEISLFTFMGLGEALGSIEASAWFVDEADEVPKNRAQEILTRLRGPVEDDDDYFALFTFNPPDTVHWLYTACTGRDFQEKAIETPWMVPFIPMPRENERNLPRGYYDELLKRLPKDMADRLVRGLWGATFPGDPVYKQFSNELHVKDDLKIHPDGVLFRFWDFGYQHPYCVWGTLDWQGRWLGLHELLGTEIEASAFARQVKQETNVHFPGHLNSIVDFGDPAVVQKKDTGSTLATLMKEGILIRHRHSLIEEGLRIARQRLELLIDRQPAVQLDRKGCPILIRALSGGYHLDEDGKKPVKDGFYDHPADAFRYGLLNLFAGSGYTVGGQSNFTTNFGNLPDSIASEG